MLLVASAEAAEGRSGRGRNVARGSRGESNVRCCGRGCGRCPSASLGLGVCGRYYVSINNR